MRTMTWNVVSEVGLPKQNTEVLLTYDITTEDKTMRYTCLGASLFLSSISMPNIDSNSDSRLNAWDLENDWVGPGFYALIKDDGDWWYRFICPVKDAIAWIEVEPYTE